MKELLKSENILENELMISLIDFGKSLIIGILVLIIGFYIVKKITRFVYVMMEKKDVELSVRLFLKNIINVMLKLLVIISVAQIVGLKMTSLIALLGAMGLAIGLSLKGTLSNFAGGIILLFNKPFKIGDFIEFAGHEGIVKEISILSTIIITPDLKTVIIPNGEISESTLTNFSKEPVRRVDFEFGIGYSDDYDKAKGLILDVAKSNSMIHADPEPFVAISQLADSSVNIVVRVWTDSENYWDVHFFMLENVKKSFDNNSINIPFPQRDVHIYNHSNNN